MYISVDLTNTKPTKEKNSGLSSSYENAVTLEKIQY